MADGTRIIVNSGLIRLCEDDNELSVVLAQEIARNAMRHVSAKTADYTLGTLFDILAAAYGVITQGAFGDIGARPIQKNLRQKLIWSDFTSWLVREFL